MSTNGSSGWGPNLRTPPASGVSGLTRVSIPCSRNPSSARLLHKRAIFGLGANAYPSEATPRDIHKEFVEIPTEAREYRASRLRHCPPRLRGAKAYT
jgi:hypothetical protein